MVLLSKSLEQTLDHIAKLDTRTKEMVASGADSSLGVSQTMTATINQTGQDFQKLLRHLSG